MVFRVHTWLGLHFCILLFVIFASGVLLLYSSELKFLGRAELWIAPPAAEATPASPGRIYDRVLAAQPGRQVSIIATAPRPWFGREVYGAGYTAVVHPVTGEVLGYRGRTVVRDLIRSLHDSLLVPVQPVHVAVNALSFVVLALVATGLITYRRFWKGWFRTPPRGADRRTRNGIWHRLTAVWVAPFLLASALGSTVFFLNAVGWKEEMPPAPAAAERAGRLPAGFDGAALDALLATCQAAMPGFRESVTVLPETPRDPLRFNGSDPLSGSWLSGVECAVDPGTGQLLRTARVADGNAMATIKAVAVTVHYGTWAGWVSITLWTVFGTASLYLILTGMRVFASRTVALRRGGAPGINSRGTVSLVVEGLGVFKWAYAAAGLGIAAMLVRAALF